MASSHQPQPSSSRNPKTEFLPLPPPPLPSIRSPPTSGDADSEKPGTTGMASVLAPSPQDIFLSNSSHLTRCEVMKRRAHYFRQLSKCYRDYFWSVVEEVRVHYRDYLWKYGLSPYKEDEDREREKENDNGIFEGSGETNLISSTYLLCAYHGCKLKAMALTKFCHLHILSDSKQQLYKPCDYVIKSAPAGPITCGKPILRSTIPSLCNVHFQKAQKHVTRALKKAGLNASSSGRIAPKFHVLVAEYVREIQARRKAALKASRNKIVVAKKEFSN